MIVYWHATCSDPMEINLKVLTKKSGAGTTYKIDMSAVTELQVFDKSLHANVTLMASSSLRSVRFHTVLH